MVSNFDDQSFVIKVNQADTGPGYSRASVARLKFMSERNVCSEVEGVLFETRRKSFAGKAAQGSISVSLGYSYREFCGERVCGQQAFIELRQ